MSRIVLQGEKNTFSCHAAGYPPPAITWYRDDPMQVQQTSRLLVSPYGDLTMVSVALSDDGTYRCVVNNTRGTIQALAVLTVHGQKQQSFKQMFSLESNLSLTTSQASIQKLLLKTDGRCTRKVNYIETNSSRIF